MLFTPAAKAELLAFVDSLEPSVDPAPLLARIAELEAEVAALTSSVQAMQANQAAAKVLIQDAADLL